MKVEPTDKGLTGDFHLELLLHVIFFGQAAAVGTFSGQRHVDDLNNAVSLRTWASKVSTRRRSCRFSSRSRWFSSSRFWYVGWAMVTTPVAHLIATFPNGHTE
jgi:hypothetical protein